MRRIVPDLLRDGRRRLGVVAVHGDGRSEEAFARMLEWPQR